MKRCSIRIGHEITFSEKCRYRHQLNWHCERVLSVLLSTFFQNSIELKQSEPRVPNTVLEEYSHRLDTSTVGMFVG